MIRVSKSERLKLKFILWLKFLSRIPFTTFSCGRAEDNIFGKYYACIHIKADRYGYHGYTVGVTRHKLHACIIDVWLCWIKEVLGDISFIWRKWE